MASLLIWHPEKLNARLMAAATPARLQWASIARGRCESRRVAATIGVAGDRVVAAHPLAMILEEGARPHEIEPRQAKALRFSNGDFVSGAVEHPGSPAKPFLKPTLPLWPETYRARARGAFRGI